MPAPPALQKILKKVGWVERVFTGLLLLYIALLFAAPSGVLFAAVQFASFILGIWIAVRLLRTAMRHAIWRLRNRLIVTYLFIGGVPILLIAALVGLSIYGIASQVAVYLVTAELDRRVAALQSAAESIIRTDAPARAETMRRMGDLFYKDRFPGINILLRTPAGVMRYPESSTENPPPMAAEPRSGVVVKDSAFFIWAHVPYKGGDVTVLAPMPSEQLSQLVPNLGTAELLSTHPSGRRGTLRLKVGDRDLEVQQPKKTSAELPPPLFIGDTEVAFAAVTPVSSYDDPATSEQTLLYVTSRLSAVYNVLVTRKSDYLQVLFPILLTITAIAFLIVEIISLITGITMTRTITSAIHRLYEGTQHIMQGEFSHRIEVKGRDQLAEVGHSFNDMTERIEKLLAIAKEKERLQSEIEIAREVQSQLYPKKVPDARNLKLTAVCKPARMVSGDYFDYDRLRGDQIALAIGDVAGKGISAALLMATLQSALRTEFRNSAQIAAAAGNGAHFCPVSTSSLVVHLNEQLHAYTSPEKYATFYLGIFDENSSVLRYTNAGHLPPILVRDGQASRLNVDGTVVGAFPFAKYDESQLELTSGDLLVCFTDGVSEPENEFGEMFGEDRLVDIVMRNAHKNEGQIVETIISAVEQWTNSPELQDDMTLLLVRRE
jgi:sigma-B regulation protein RsbU (phosphoserine phosphatase)